MNVDNENVDRVTDLGLALGHSSQCVQRGLNNDSGAGANAGSGLNMTFVTNNPLSELVWSPHKGPSNVALLPAQGITGRKHDTDNHTGGDNLFLTSVNTSLQVMSEAAGVMPVHGQRCKAKAGTGDEAEEINTAPREGDGEGVGIFGCVESRIPKTTDTGENQISTLPGEVNRKSTDILSIMYDHTKPNEAQSEPLSEKPIGADRNIGSNNFSLQIGFNVTSGAHPINESEAPVDPIGNQIFQGRGKSFEKIESTAENDLQNLKNEYVLSAANDTTLRSEISPEVKGSSQQAEDMPPASKTASVKHSPTNSGVHEKRRKGKEKAFSDGMMPKDGDDSHESVESCDSAGLFPAAKRRRSFDEELVVGTKGFKKQIHHAHGSASFARQDSSFMNWISNIMKGFSHSVQEEAPFPLRVARPDVGHENLDKKLISTINKDQDPGSKIIGFQSIFQSLYCAKAEVQETRMLNVEYQVEEGSQELESSNKMSNNNSTPSECQAENTNLVGKQFLALNDRFNECRSGNGEGSSIQPKIPLDKFANSPEKGNNNSEENKSNCQLAFSSKEKERTNSNSSLGKRKTSSNDSDLPSAGRTVSKFCHRNDSLESIWITRFGAKASSSSANQDHRNPSAGLSPNRSLECLQIIPHAQNHIGFPVGSAVFEGGDHSAEDQLLVSGKDLQKSSSKSIGHDAIASVFARRLDALKHITSPRVTSNAAQANVTCFFCGIKGHNLRDCSETTQIELEELTRNLNTYSGMEEQPSLCIRCFQRSHWAVSCPKACSSKRLQVESNSSFSEMQQSSGYKQSLKLQSGKDSQLHPDVSLKFSEGAEMRTEKDVNLKADEIMDFRKKKSCTSPILKLIASSSVEHTSKENQIMPLSYFVSEQNPGVPHGPFDIVKRLRLSRSEIMKWKNSHTSLSQLDGFFLRLRLGKWEEGLGGTGYHVACIIGSQGDNESQDAKSSIPVKVGGIKCLVESRFVSNNDFLEDELMAWWSITSRNGDKIPSKEDLVVKVKTKRMLGF